MGGSATFGHSCTGRAAAWSMFGEEALVARTQDAERVALDEARAHVRHFFAVTATMTPAEVELLWRAERRSGVHWLSTHPDFPQAVADRSWGAVHMEVAREITASVRAQAARLARWSATTRGHERTGEGRTGGLQHP